jgi:hypothetical protein
VGRKQNYSLPFSHLAWWGSKGFVKPYYECLFGEGAALLGVPEGEPCGKRRLRLGTAHALVFVGIQQGEHS